MVLQGHLKVKIHVPVEASVVLCQGVKPCMSLVQRLEGVGSGRTEGNQLVWVSTILEEVRATESPERL